MVLLSSNEGIEDKAFLVTGGAGFVGAALCLELVRRGASKVTSLDVSKTSSWLPKLRAHGVVCITGDVSRKKDVEKAVNGANCVFHLASYGMSGKEMLQARRIDEVNLDGTGHVLDSCQKYGVERLVYTSTYNVVFEGQEIRNGDENMDYCPMEKHSDHYGRSKALAEQLVRRANGAPLRGNKGVLRTSVIRPAAIYGPGEERHLPRILNHARWGLLKFRIGGANVQTDWVYIDNLVHAQLLASVALLDIPNKPGLGQVYFISDGAPVNTFKFLRPLVEGLGYKFPEYEISVKSAMYLANFLWVLYGFLYPVLKRSWLPQPFILPAEVHKVGITHYFSILKATHELQYVPVVNQREGLKRTLEYLKEHPVRPIESPPATIWVGITVGMLLTFVSGFFPPQILGPLRYVQSLSLWVFGSFAGVKSVFYIATFLHALEAGFAWYLARHSDPDNLWPWYFQTLVVGYPSLRLLIRRSSEKKKA